MYSWPQFAVVPVLKGKYYEDALQNAPCIDSNPSPPCFLPKPGIADEHTVFFAIAATLPPCRSARQRRICQPTFSRLSLQRLSLTMESHDYENCFDLLMELFNLIEKKASSLEGSA